MDYQHKYLKYKTKYLNLKGGSDNFILSSSAFKNNELIPDNFACDFQKKGNIPPLTWENPPANTKSFALIVDDPDAPNGTFTHFVIWNIDKNTRSISNVINLNNIGNIGINSTDANDYMAPCPPKGHGVHRYYFKLYALDTILNLNKNTDADILRKQLNKHILQVATLMGKYKRK